MIQEREVKMNLRLFPLWRTWSITLWDVPTNEPLRNPVCLQEEFRRFVGESPFWLANGGKVLVNLSNLEQLRFPEHASVCRFQVLV